MDALDRIALDRLGLLAVTSGEADAAVTIHLLAELAHLGVRISDLDALSAPLAASPRELLDHIRTRRGGKASFAPLFPGFPDRLPATDDVQLRFLLGATRLVSTGWRGGDVADSQLRAALDFTDLDWWPASSVPQDAVTTFAERARQELLPGDTRVEWMELRLASLPQRDALLREWMQASFAAASSLRADVVADLHVLLTHFGLDAVDLSTVRFRETRTLLLELIWAADPARLATLDVSPDDLLRLFAMLTGSDTSLMDRIRFPKLNRSQRRAVVGALEASSRLSDVFRRRGLWLALDRGLHLGELRAPRTQEVFARLRSSRHDATSALSRFEALMGSDRTQAFALLAEEAPGMLARSLRRLAAAATAPEERAALTAALQGAAERIPVRLLLAARSQVLDNGQTYPRVVFLKNGQPLAIERAPGHLALEAPWRDELVEILSERIRQHFAELSSWEGEKIFVAPELEAVLLPEALRATSEGLVQVERGSRLPLGDAPVVRLFVHWRETPEQSGADLDLSCMALDENFQLVEHVSWTNLANSAMVHSGDLTSAPLGAQEFLDINLHAAREAARERGWRYLVPAILRYSAPAFSALEEAWVGWMLREDCSADRKSFDPKTVANAFALTGSQRTAVPFLLDLDRSEVCYVDTYLGGTPYAAVERESGGIGTLVSAVAERARTKVSVAALIREHAGARGGEIVSDPGQASITFGLDDEATFNVLRPERLLAELL